MSSPDDIFRDDGAACPDENAGLEEAATPEERTTTDDAVFRQARNRLDARMERHAAASPENHDTSPGTSPAHMLENWSFASKAIVLASAVLLLIVLIAFLAISCSRESGASGDSSTSQASSQAELITSDSSSQSASSATPAYKPDVDELEYILGEEEAAKLITRAKTDDDALWIAAHPQAYAFSEQAKLLKLAAEDPNALPYLRDFPRKYPSKKPVSNPDLAMDASSPSVNVPDTKIPHLYQWDRRWGYTDYNYSPFGLSGCGPTSLAMVYQGLTGKTDKTPYDMGQLAHKGGYVIEGSGTDGSLFTGTAEELGLICEELYPSAEVIAEALKEGKVIVDNVGIGTFTDYGHFFVLTGLDTNGRVIINDPYSVVRSAKTWNLELVASESLVLYAFSTPDAQETSDASEVAEASSVAATAEASGNPETA